MRSILTICFIFLLCHACKQQDTSMGTDIPNQKEVLQLTEKVANWQIETFEDQGKYRALPSTKRAWDNRTKHHDLDWTNAALYAGMFELTKVSTYPKYINWLVSIGDRNEWNLHRRMYHADDHAVGQLYLSLNQNIRLKKIASIVPTKQRFDSIMTSEEGQKYLWDWCDALFMSPPVWARLAKVTKDSTYLQYMDSQYKMTYNELWDPEEHLFYRDKSFFDSREKNGSKVFWSRGNGWVFAGLALMIPDLPEDWEGRAFYETLFVQMAERLKAVQRADGTWSGGLLGDPNDYPTIETSGSSFFTFGMAWGINSGLLDRETYEPVVFKAWHSLKNCVNEDGMLGYVQPIGAAPGESFKDYTEVYGIGAFLAAGSELYTYLNRFYPLPRDEQHATFMKDGGWCWYQDPRALISHGKLLIGGLSGQSGDVRLGIYDLKSASLDSTLVLHKELQTDDHNVPALYKRPDGGVLAVWAKHGSEKTHYYTISDPDNYLLWGDVKSYEHVYDHENGVTYMNLYHMENEDRLYNFYRDGSTFNPFFITSDDHGETWGNRSHFIANDIEGYQRPYPRYYQIDPNTVGISYTDGHPRRYGNNLYYAQFTNGTFYTADGTEIKHLAEGPLRTSEGEKIFAGSDTDVKSIFTESVPRSAWTCAMATDQNNHPHMGYSVYLNDADHRFRMASWDGQSWHDREIAYAGKCLYKVESSYTGLLAFDPEDPEKVYISTDVDPSTGADLGGVHEIYEALVGIDDDISSIEWKAVTSNSNYRNIRPIIVADEGYKVLLWLNGPWHDYTDYDADVKGIILDKPNA
ncbi:glycoside hydrolase family 88 protein [Aestuariivivens sediminicola]|uniref:glycoside hydrolase family 88 protein n=1 Tax=Aestuariivivens sediminicola TaxID=2913560 RepID=UPI001F57B5BA|nr:glycoside hydrolase family 88 protein [Aestuariivivens sediminicola]